MHISVLRKAAEHALEVPEAIEENRSHFVLMCVCITTAVPVLKDKDDESLLLYCTRLRGDVFYVGGELDGTVLSWFCPCRRAKLVNDRQQATL